MKTPSLGNKSHTGWELSQDKPGWVFTEIAPEHYKRMLLRYAPVNTSGHGEGRWELFWYTPQQTFFIGSGRAFSKVHAFAVAWSVLKFWHRYRHKGTTS